MILFKKKRIAAIVMALVMMLAVQPMYTEVALAAVAIPNTSADYTNNSDNTEYTLENVESCTSIGITGTGNVLNVSGSNSIQGSLGNSLTIKLSKGNWGSTMLTAESLVTPTSIDIRELSFAHLLDYSPSGGTYNPSNDTPEPNSTRLISVTNASGINSVPKSGSIASDGSITVNGMDETSNRVKVYSDVTGTLTATDNSSGTVTDTPTGSVLSIESASVKIKSPIDSNKFGIDVSNWNGEDHANSDTLKNWTVSDSSHAFSVYGEPNVNLPVGTTKTVLTSDTNNFFANASIDPSIAYADESHPSNVTMTPIAGVQLQGTRTGGVRVSGDGKSLEYVQGTVTVNKVTFTDVEWKDSGALLDHGSTLQNVSFDGAAVDTSNINFTNIQSLYAGRQMTLVSDFGATVGTVIGSKYKIGSSLEGAGKASLNSGGLVFTAETAAGGSSTPISAVEPIPVFVPSDPAINLEPQIGDAKGWNAIENKITQTPEGGKLDVDMKDTTNLPSNTLEAIKDKDLTLVLRMQNGVVWSVNGKDNTGEVGDVDLGVKLNTNGVSEEIVNNVAGGKDSMQIEVGGNKPPRFRGKVTIPVTVKHSDLIANLYQFVQTNSAQPKKTKFVTKKETNRIEAYKKDETLDQGYLKYMSCGVVKSDGTVDLDFDGKTLTQDNKAGNSFVIVFADKSLDPNATVEDTNKLTLKSKVKKGKVTLSWNKLAGAKKYRIFQKVAGVYLPVKTIKASKPAKATVSKALTKTKVKGKTDYKNKSLIIGKKYTFAVCAYVNNKWTKITKTSRVTVKVRK